MIERRAKIVATLGPASQDEATLTRLVEAGMNVARLNFSHGTRKGYVELVERIRKVSEQANSPICVLQDLQGPKIRVGTLPSGGIALLSGEQVTLSTKVAESNGHTI